MSVSNDDEQDFNATNGNQNTNEVRYELKIESIIRTLETELNETDRLLITNIKLNESFEPSVLGLYDDRLLPTLLSTLKVPVLRKERSEVQDYLMSQYGQLLESNRIEYRHYRLGWYSHNGEELFLLQRNNIGGVISECCRNSFQFKSGDIDSYKTLLDNVVYKNDNLSLAVVIGFTAVVVSRLKERLHLNAIICNLSGISSTGKTTAAMLMASLFAAPDKSGLNFNFNATNSAMPVRLMGIHGLPMIIDDILVNEKIDISELIYTFANGSNKDRCGTNGQIKADSNASFSGVIVLTSEYPVLDRGNKNQGLIVRTLAMNDIPWTLDADTADLIQQTVSENFGWLGELFANFILSFTIDALYQRYLQAKNRLHKIMPDFGGFTARLEKQYAVIYLTVLLVNECFNKQLNADNLLNICLHSEASSIKQNDNAEVALEAVKCFILTHKQNFVLIKQGTTTHNFGDFYGAIKIDCLNNVEVYIMNEVVDGIITKTGISDKRSVKHKWKESGVIKTDKDRYDCKYSKSPIEDKRYTHFIFLVTPLFEEIEAESPFTTYEQLIIDESISSLPYRYIHTNLVPLNECLNNEIQFEYYITTLPPTIPLLPNTDNNREKMNV